MGTSYSTCCCTRPRPHPHHLPNRKHRQYEICPSISTDTARFHPGHVTSTSCIIIYYSLLGRTPNSQRARVAAGGSVEMPARPSAKPACMSQALHQMATTPSALHWPASAIAASHHSSLLAPQRRTRSPAAALRGRWGGRSGARTRERHGQTHVRPRNNNKTRY